jgi:hypothetical protein
MMTGVDFVRISRFCRSANADGIDWLSPASGIVAVESVRGITYGALTTAYAPRTRNSGPIISALFGWQSKLSATTKQPKEPVVRALMPSDHPLVDSTSVPETSNSAEPHATTFELRPAEQVEPEPPESSPTAAVPAITGFGRLNRTRGIGLSPEIWACTAEAHPPDKRSADHSDYGVSERQLNEVYTKLRSGLGTLARQKFKVEELKWLRKREAIGNNFRRIRGVHPVSDTSVERHATRRRTLKVSARLHQ